MPFSPESSTSPSAEPDQSGLHINASLHTAAFKNPFNVYILFKKIDYFLGFNTLYALSGHFKVVNRE
jgi:hypothetical protein